MSSIFLTLTRDLHRASAQHAICSCKHSQLLFISFNDIQVVVSYGINDCESDLLPLAVSQVDAECVVRLFALHQLANFKD